MMKVVECRGFSAAAPTSSSELHQHHQRAIHSPPSPLTPSPTSLCSSVSSFAGMGDPQFAKYPDLQLSQHIFHITNPSSSKGTQRVSLKILQDAIKENKMA